MNAERQRSAHSRESGNPALGTRRRLAGFARTLRDNGFKVELATRVLVATLGDIAGAGA